MCSFFSEAVVLHPPNIPQEEIDRSHELVHILEKKHLTLSGASSQSFFDALSSINDYLILHIIAIDNEVLFAVNSRTRFNIRGLELGPSLRQFPNGIPFYFHPR